MSEVEYPFGKDSKRDLFYATGVLKLMGAKMLRFPMRIGTLRGHSIDEVGYEGRGANAIKKLAANKGYKDVAELVEGIGSIDELRRMPGVGEKTAATMYFKLLEFQYSLIPDNQKGDYMLEVYNKSLEDVKDAD